MFRRSGLRCREAILRRSRYSVGVSSVKGMSLLAGMLATNAEALELTLANSFQSVVPAYVVGAPAAFKENA